MADSDILFGWANDPDTRAWSKSTAAISRPEHDQWMNLYVAHGYPVHLVMMADTDHGSVGTVRFDADKRDVMSFNVSITVAPEQRAKGLGFAMLEQACSLMSDARLTADIHVKNRASRHIFEKCGFEWDGASRAGYLKYQRNPVS